VLTRALNPAGERIDRRQDHLYLAGPCLVRYWGSQRAGSGMTPLKMYLDAGLPVSGGTDASVVPYPPLWVIYHFVTRDTITGGVLGADQKVSREEALRLVTRNHWYLTFEENTKGTIAPGRYADMVVLPEDILTVPEKRLEQMRVLMTMVGGKPVHRDADWAKVTATCAFRGRVTLRESNRNLLSQEGQARAPHAK
jgi:predicted amidohydrolase YtcJ